MEDLKYTSWPKNPKTILLQIAMQDEASEILTTFSLQPDSQVSSNPIIDAYTGKFNEINLIVVIPKKDPLYKVDSVNTESAAMVAVQAINLYKPDLFLSVGTCGGVKHENNKDINVRDICIPKLVYFFEREMIIPPFLPYTEGKYPLLDPTPVNKLLNYKIVNCGTSNSFKTDDSSAKQKQIDIIEMEAAAQCKVCYILNTPFTAIKVVSDVEMDTPEERQNSFLEFLKVKNTLLADNVKKFLEKVNSFA